MLHLNPKSQDNPSGKARSSLISSTAQVFKYIRRQNKLKVIRIIFLMAIAGLLELLTIASLIPLISILLERDDSKQSLLSDFTFAATLFSDLVAVGIFFFIIAVLAGILRIYCLSKSSLIAASISSDLSSSLLLAKLNSDYETYISEVIPETISSLTFNCERIMFYYFIPILGLLSSGLVALFILIGMLIVDANFTIATALSSMLVYGVVSLVSRKRLKLYGIQQSSLSRDVNRIASDALNTYRDIQLSNSSEYVVKEYREVTSALREIQAKILFFLSAPKLSIETFTLLFIAAFVVFTGVNSSFYQQIPYFAAVLLGMMKILPLVQKLYDGWAQPSTALASVEDLIKDLEITDQYNYSIHCRRLVLSEVFELRNVDYSYPGNDLKVINNLSLRIPRGSVVGIKGASGVGKSTLADLCMGFICPSAGSILIDGKTIDASSFYSDDLVSWRTSVEHVPQSVFVTKSSIKENILLGLSGQERDELSFERFSRCMFATCLEDFIGSSDFTSALSLSGGQRQRLGIARALYRDPDFLVLDECTSALDDRTEDMLLKRLLNGSMNQTVLLISHRSAPFRYCDFVYELSKDRLELIN